jgi:hypothetical protein
MNKFGCFVYFNKKTGDIELITNERQGRKKNVIEVDPDFYSKLQSREYNHTHYAVGYLKKPDGSIELSLIKREQPTIYTFRNTQFVSITNRPTDNTELIVTWRPTHWEFVLSEDAKLRITNSLDQEMVPFFVILESDFDFLIRTIFLKPFELRTRKKVVIPFEEDIERDPNKVTLATKLLFQSYGINKHE